MVGAPVGGSGALGGDPHPVKEEEEDPAAWAQSNLPASSAWSRGAATIINPKPKPPPVPPAPAPVAPPPQPPAEPPVPAVAEETVAAATTTAAAAAGTVATQASPQAVEAAVTTPIDVEPVAATPPQTPRQQPPGSVGEPAPTAPSPAAASSPAAVQGSPSPVARPPSVQAAAQGTPESAVTSTAAVTRSPGVGAPGAQLHMQSAQQQQKEEPKTVVSVPLYCESTHCCMFMFFR